MIHAQMEENQRRRFALAGAAPTATSPSQLEKLEGMLAARHAHRRRVPGAQGPAARPVSREHPSMRVVSLVPSSTETLLALGGDVVACSKFCEQPRPPPRRRDQEPRHRGDRARSRPDLVVLDREENRIEDHDALVAAGLDVFVSDVTDLSGAVARGARARPRRIGAAGAGRGQPAPRGAPSASLGEPHSCRSGDGHG